MARAKKRADGRYCAQIYLGRDENGKRQYKSVYAKSPAELKEKEGITCRQMDNYRRAVKHWKETLEGFEIGQVRADDIEQVLVDLADRGLSQRTINLYRSAIRQIMRRAVGRAIPTNPVEQVELAAVGRKEEQRRP